MKFKIHNKKAFYSFIPFALVTTVTPWFVDFRAIDPKYSLWFLGLMLVTGGACLLTCHIEGSKETEQADQEVDHE